jgi:lysophospholipase L1-like esterase
MKRSATLLLAPVFMLIAAAGRGDSKPEGALRYLALGDSYTIGEGVDSAGRWPVQLARALRARKLDVADPEIIARTGWTTDELAAGIKAAAPRGPYSLVSLLIGVNNQYRGRDAEQYRTEFKALLAQAAGFAGGRASHVVVLSIPDWGVTPFATGRDRAKIGAEIDRFNAIGREETVVAGARWVDVTPASREPHEGWVGAKDGLHPTAAQYARWAALALDSAAAALAR